MFELVSAPLFVFIPFFAFAVIFILVAVIKICMVAVRSGEFRNWKSWFARPSGMAPRSSRVQTTQHSQASSSVIVDLNGGYDETPVLELEPPSYYAGVMSTTASGNYSMYVPPYSATAAPGGSVRDPRHFGGLAGIQAPPPYPPPPSYNQISAIPEMPPISNVRLNSSGGQNFKTADFPPVD